MHFCLFQTHPAPTRDAEVFYSIVSPPKSGSLVLLLSQGEEGKEKKLRDDGVFSPV